MKEKKDKTQTALSEQDRERLELLQKAHERKGQQLKIDTQTGSIEEINEIREIIGKKFDNPEEKYNLYYKGIRNLLMSYLPKGEQYKEGRQLIYDEKNIFLTQGLKKSDGGGIRGGDSRMAYQEQMNEMLDVILKWVSESQNPMDLYNLLYALNEKYGYGHENYDDTTISYANALKKISEEEK